MADQQWFAAVSGDENPLHMDPAWAAKTFPGKPVVHGMHAVLWSLDAHLRDHPAALIGVRAMFMKPILLGDVVELDTSRGEGLRLLVRDEPMAVIYLSAPVPQGAAPTAEPHSPSRPPQDRAILTLTGVVDAIGLPDAGEELSGRFPALAATIGAQSLLGLAGVSTVVGMECPGLHSVLSEVSAVLTHDAPAFALAFEARKHDAGFSRVEIRFQGYGLAGVVAAFTGRPDEPAAADEAIRTLVRPGEFEGAQPLIIGASSGLGAVTARILAAGGAEPILGWRGSSTSVDATAAAVAALGGRNRLAPFDVTEPEVGATALAEAGWRGREVYYFASPRIFRRRIEAYQAGDLRDFLAAYVDGFYETVRALLKGRDGAPLRVLYPSSTALDESAPDLFEYRLAKAAGEQLCARLQTKYRSLSIVSVRLPRIATRQTRTAMRVKAERAEEVMAPIIRQVQGEKA